MSLALKLALKRLGIIAGLGAAATVVEYIVGHPGTFSSSPLIVAGIMAVGASFLKYVKEKLAEAEEPSE